LSNVESLLKLIPMTQQKINHFFCHPFMRQVLLTMLVLYAINYCQPLLYILLIMFLMEGLLKPEES